MAATFSAAMIVNFGKECIELGSDLAEVQNVVDVTFTTMSGKVNEWAKNAAASYGLSETMAKKYVGTFGSMAEAFGFTEQQSYDMSTALAGLAGDVASFYNITQDEAYTKLKSVFSGETETLKDLGIVMTQSALDAYALANGYGKTTSAMTEAEKVSLRFAFVQSQLQNATGDFARTQNSWANQTRILQLRFDSLKATIGQGLINVFTPVIKVVNSLIDRLTTVSEKFKALTEQIFGNAGDTTSGVSSAISGSASSAEELTNEANNSSAALDSVADSAEKAKKSVAGFDKLNVLSQESKTETNSSTPMSSTKTPSGSNSLTSAMSKAVNDFSNAWNTKGQKVINSIKKAFGQVKDAVTSIGKSWINVWNNGSGEKFINNIKNYLSTIFDIIGDIAGAFTNAWNEAGRGDKLVQSYIDKWNSFIELLNVIGDTFREVWNDGTGERIWGNILDIITNCNNFTATLREKIKDAWLEGGNGERMWSAILGIVEDITGFVDDITSANLDWIEDLDLTPVTTAVADLSEGFRELLKACGNKLKDAYKNILLPLAKWTIEKAVPTLVEALAGAFELLAKFIKKIPLSLLTGIAGAIVAVVAAFKAFKIAKEVQKNFNLIKDAMLNFKTKVLAHPYAAVITVIAAAVTGLIAAMETYNQQKWENSSLKEEIDKTEELTEKWSSLGDELQQSIDSANETTLDLKVNFDNVNELKEKLLEIIEDGKIDESEEAEYKTVVDLLSEKVDGFDSQWNNLTLEEIDGKIVIKDNIETVKENLNQLVEDWEIAQAKLTLTDVYSTLQSDYMKKGIEIEATDYEGRIEESKKELIDYIFNAGNLSKEEAKIFANELIKQKGNYDKTTKSLIKQFENNTLDKTKYNNLFVDMFQANGNVFHPWETGAKDHVTEMIDGTLNLQDAQENAMATYQETGDTLDDLSGSMEALNGFTGDYNDYIRLSTEYGMSQAAVLSLLGDRGITTWSELEAAAKKQAESSKTNATESGKNTVTGYVAGVNEFKDALDKEGNAVADLFLGGLDKRLDINSPSEEMRKRGVWTIQGFINGVQEQLANVAAPFITLVSKVKTALDPIKNVFSSVFDAIKGVIRTPLNKLMEMLEDFINGIVSAINKVAEGADWAVNTIGNIFGQDWHIGPIDKVELPRFAKGGIVKAPTLAVVGDNAGANTGNPEVIAPLNKLQSMINTSNGSDPAMLRQILDYLKRIYEMFVVFRNSGGNSYEFVAKINGSEIFDEIVKQNELYKKRNGGKSAFT